MQSATKLFSEILKSNKYRPESENRYSLYIGLNLQGGNVSDLAIEGGEDPKDYHVTLLYGYFTPRSDIEDSTMRIQSAIEKIKPDIPERIVFYHERRFEASENSDKKDVIVAVAAGGFLEKLHEDLLKTLKDEKVEVEKTFPEYIPHMTLAYIDPGAEYKLRELDHSAVVKDISVDVEEKDAEGRENTFQMAKSNNEILKSSFHIQKADADKRLVFGWALVSATSDGKKIIDHQGDIVEQDDLEEGAYEYVLNFRDAGEEHIAGLRKKARMVESVVFTEDKLKAMGIPLGTVPYGWWIGFYVDDDKTWELIKNGTYKMFSIEGRAVREPIDNHVTKNLANTSKNLANTFSDLIEKFNPYHDSRGRFSTSGGAASFTYAPGKSKAHDLAIAREKERHAAAAAAKPKDENAFTPAKTKDEAIEYAKNKLGIESVNYGKLDVDTINHINQEIHEIQKKYPELADAVKEIKMDNRQGVYAAAGTNYFGKNDLYIGSTHYGKGIEHVKQNYQSDVDSGFHPANTDHKSVIWHEYGHILAYTQYKTSLGYGVKDSLSYPDNQKYVSNLKSRSFEKAVVRDAAKSLKITQKELKSRISRYAEKNPAETFAEAFAEYNCSPNPRPECVAMMKAAGLAK